MAVLVLLVFIASIIYLGYKFPKYVQYNNETKKLIQAKIESRLKALNLKEKLRKLRRR